jgi:hypothetical protein
MKLYELTAQFKSLELLADAEDLPPDVIRDTLEGLEGDFDAKVVAVAKVILSLQHDAEGIEELAKRQAARAKRLADRAESLKAYLLANMQAIERKKIQSEFFDIRVQNNAPSVMVGDEKLIPEEYMRTPPPPPKVPDKTAIAEAHKAGLEVPGTHPLQGQHLRIAL